MSATVIEISSHPRFKPSTMVEAAATQPASVAPPARVHLTREEAIKRIKVGLEKRSGKRWSVTGGRGTAWGWLRIDAPPSERTWTMQEDKTWIDTGEPRGDMSPSRREELGQLLGHDRPAHPQGESIPSGGSYWDEYIERAETGTSAIKSTPYWD